MAKWREKINIKSILFKREDLNTSSEHHGSGRYPINCNFDSEITNIERQLDSNYYSKINILISQNTISIGGAH